MAMATGVGAAARPRAAARRGGVGPLRSRRARRARAATAGGGAAGDGGLCEVAAAVRAHVAELQGLDMPAEEVRLLLLATPPLGADYGGLALQAAYGVAMGAGEGDDVPALAGALDAEGVGSGELVAVESMLAQLVRDRREVIESEEAQAVDTPLLNNAVVDSLDLDEEQKQSLFPLVQSIFDKGYAVAVWSGVLGAVGFITLMNNLIMSSRPQ